jgi:hypothetical protein
MRKVVIVLGVGLSVAGVFYLHQVYAEKAQQDKALQQESQLDTETGAVDKTVGLLDDEVQMQRKDELKKYRQELPRLNTLSDTATKTGADSGSEIITIMPGEDNSGGGDQGGGEDNLPPGQGGTPPGQGGTPPGQGGTPPGQGGTPPGQGGTPPGQGKK